ncbi:hypothetical protein DFP73DRAFT_543618 [Morchella snyderi]|nr:hypothetical protein DFP73DRAFT_543618 [Morchella snyderi]
MEGFKRFCENTGLFRDIDMNTTIERKHNRHITGVQETGKEIVSGSKSPTVEQLLKAWEYGFTQECLDEQMTPSAPPSSPTDSEMGCTSAGETTHERMAQWPEQVEKCNLAAGIPPLLHRPTEMCVESMQTTNVTEGASPVARSLTDVPATGLLGSIYAHSDPVVIVEAGLGVGSTWPPVVKAGRAAFHLRIANKIVQHPLLIQKLGVYRRTYKTSHHYEFLAALVKVHPEAKRLAATGDMLANLFYDTCHGKKYLQPLLDALAWGRCFDRLKRCNQTIFDGFHRHEDFLRRHGFGAPLLVGTNQHRNHRERLKNIRRREDQARRDELSLMSNLAQMNLGSGQSSNSREISDSGSNSKCDEMQRV